MALQNLIHLKSLALEPRDKGIASFNCLVSGSLREATDVLQVNPSFVFIYSTSKVKLSGR